MVTEVEVMGAIGNTGISGEQCETRHCVPGDLSEIWRASKSWAAIGEALYRPRRAGNR